MLIISLPTCSMAILLTMEKLHLEVLWLTRQNVFQSEKMLCLRLCFGLSFKDGNWAAVLDLTPDGETTTAESSAAASKQIIEKKIKFGALGAREVPRGGVEFGFWLPGTTNEFAGGFGSTGVTTPTQVVRRRYNPVEDGFSQSYQVGFRLSKGESFNTMVRDAWRWAWESLKPQVTPVDIEVARRAMIDHLADHVLVVGDMAGIGFLYDAVTGRPGSYRRTTIPPADLVQTQC